MSTTTENDEVRGHRKVREGRVIGAAMDKTIVVQIERRVRHPLFGKEIRKKSKLYAHDEGNLAQIGQWVEVMETRPLSKLKHWRLVKVLEHR